MNAEKSTSFPVANRGKLSLLTVRASLCATPAQALQELNPTLTADKFINVVLDFFVVFFNDDFEIFRFFEIDAN